MKTWLSVLTCPSRGISYLPQTLASLERAGAELAGERIVHVDGPADSVAVPEGWDVASVSDVAAGGARRAMLSIMRRAHAAGVELLLYFEDDVILCRKAIAAMIEIGVPEPLGLVSYCDLLWHPDCPALELRAFPGNPRGAPVADGGFVGCQALAIPARTLERLATLEVPAWIDRNNCDATIGTSSEAYGIIDSLAQHVGVESAIMGRPYLGGRWRPARGFPGEDFDADRLPRRWELNPIGERCLMHAGVLHEGGRPCAGQSAHHEARMRGPAA